MPQFAHLLLQFHPQGRSNQAVGTHNSALKLQLEKIIFLLPNISFSPLSELLSPIRIRMEQRVWGFEISCLNAGTQSCEYPLSSQIHRSSCVKNQIFSFNLKQFLDAFAQSRKAPIIQGGAYTGWRKKNACFSNNCNFVYFQYKKNYVNTKTTCNKYSFDYLH